MKRTRSKFGPALAIAALTAAGALTGCGAGNFAAIPTQFQGAAIQGRVRGGQQPVVGATIQLYAVGSTGYGSAATPLVPTVVQSQADGSFTLNVTPKYNCPSASALVYLTATGGNSGYSNNPNLTMMAALGPCGNLTPTTYTFMNEITTVASVWALSPFMSGITNIGSTANNMAGLANAFADVNTLVNTIDGTTPGPALPAGATVPTLEINTLADILSSCINSGGGVANDNTTACGTLFGAANPGGTAGTAPTDTVTAAMHIAQNPALGIHALFGLVTSSSPFPQTLPTQPNDFTIAVNYTAGAMSAPSALAADASGNVWIANATGNTVTELSHLGVVQSGTGFTNNLNAPSAIAIDSTGAPWITNKGNSTVSRLTSSGAASGTPYTGGGLNAPSTIAFDNVGNAWISNSGAASITEINSSGTLINYTASGITAPLAIGVDPH